MLLSSFALFCLLIYGIFQLGSFIYDNATTSLSAIAQRNNGSDLTIKTVSSARFAVPFSSTTSVNEGDSIRTGADTQADIAFPDGSIVHIFPNSQVTINQIKASRFSKDHISVTISQQPLPDTDPRQGSIVIVGVPSAPTNGYRSSQVLINTTTDTNQPIASVVLTPDSTTRISIANDPNTNQPYSRAVALRGAVQVSALPDTASPARVGLDQMATVGFGGQPSVAAAWDEFIADGSFNSSKDAIGNLSDQSTVWGPVRYDQGGDGGGVNGQVEITDTLVFSHSEHVAYFYRIPAQLGYSGVFTDYASVAIGQELDRDLSPYLSGGKLRLSADVKLINQSVLGGGFSQVEYPIIFKLTYQNADSSAEVAWQYGYYFTPDPNRPVDPALGQQVSGGQWVHIEIPNLFAIEQLKGMRRIVRLEIYAAGHEYESQITNISLAAR